MSWFTRFAWLIALLLGLALLGNAIWSSHNAAKSGLIPPESALSSASGRITAVREVTRQRKNRFGGGSETVGKYYELDLQPASGQPIRLSVHQAVPLATLKEAIGGDITVISPWAAYRERKSAIGGDVTVRYDASSSSNTTYVIQRDGKDLVAYADIAPLEQKEAQDSLSGKWTFTLVALAIMLLAIAGRWWGGRALNDS